MQEVPVQNGQLLHKLSSVEGEGFGEAWEGFFMNPSQVRALVEIPDRHGAGKLLQVGRTWNGAGWNTGKASRELHRLTGVWDVLPLYGSLSIQLGSLVRN